MELSMLNITYRDRKQTYVRENVTDVIGKVRRWNGPGQGTSTEYEITDGQITRSPYEGKLSRGSPARRWKGTIWQRIALDRLMWKQHAEAFTQPRDAMAAQ